MRIYTIAVKQTMCHGHGDYRTDEKIVRLQIGSDLKFPPVFQNPKDASSWLDSHKDHLFCRAVVVSLDLIPE